MEACTQNPLHPGRDNDTANAVGHEIELASRGQAALGVSEAEVGGKPHPQFDLTPFPCAHEGCHAFHGDFATGLCPLHSGGGGGGGAVSTVMGWMAPSQTTIRRLRFISKVLVIGSVTVVMAVMEANDKSLLLLLAYSAVGA